MSTGSSQHPVTPNAEKYLIEADSLRRRQLRSALLHGSGRTWRDRQRIWPGMLVGVIAVAVVIAAIAVAGAFKKQEDNTRREQQQQEQRLHPSHTPSTTPVTR